MIQELEPSPCVLSPPARALVLVSLLSLTHTEPPLLRPIPQHIRQGTERFLEDMPFFLFLDVFNSHPPLLPSVIFCPPLPLFFSTTCLPLSPPISPPSHTLPLSCFPPSTSSLLAPTSCCCARIGLNLPPVWMAKKKQFSGHLPHTFFFVFYTTGQFSGGPGVPQITFPRT